MLAIGGGALADIDGDIKDGTFDAVDQFTLSIWWALEMEATHHTIRGHGFIVLHEIDCMPKYRSDFLVKLSLRKTFKEVPSFVAKNFGLYNKNTFYISLNNLHIIRVVVCLN